MANNQLFPIYDVSPSHSDIHSIISRLVRLLSFQVSPGIPATQSVNFDMIILHIKMSKESFFKRTSCQPWWSYLAQGFGYHDKIPIIVYLFEARIPWSVQIEKRLRSPHCPTFRGCSSITKSGYFDSGYLSLGNLSLSQAFNFSQSSL